MNILKRTTSKLICLETCIETYHYRNESTNHSTCKDK